jgi:hypothetical protein
MLMDGSEFWALKATHGVGLDLVIEELFEAGIYPKWDEVLLAAKADGANIDKLVRELVMHFEHFCKKDSKEYMILMITKLYEKMVKDGKI